MSLDKAKLMDFLSLVGAELRRKITLVAAGGTALTLLDVKPSTIDLDFTGPSKDVAEFKRVLSRIAHGFKIDTWPNGMVFSQLLPEDYLKRSVAVKNPGNIELRALHPVDIVVTKIGRLDQRDFQDIEDCVRKFRLSKNQILLRAKRVQYVGRKENYEANLRIAIGRLFRRGGSGSVTRQARGQPKPG